ncbi:MAG: amidohydrolase, partial [Pseudomonadota bacterium]
MTSKTIDIHAHWFPQSFIDLIAEKGDRFGAQVNRKDDGDYVVKVGRLTAAPLDPRFIDIERRLAAMDDTDVDVQALSLTQPMVYWADRRLSQELTETFNDALVDAHARAPD